MENITALMNLGALKSHMELKDNLWRFLKAPLSLVIYKYFFSLILSHLESLLIQIANIREPTKTLVVNHQNLNFSDYG